MDLSQVLKSAQTALGLGNLILVSLNEDEGYRPQNLDGTLQNGILFNYEGEQKNILQSDITDHFVEDNTSIQDQIAIRPVQITTKGYVGELNNVVPKELRSLQIAADSLYTISGYVPEQSISAIQAFNKAFFAYQAGKNIAKTATAAWKSINNSDFRNQTEQSMFYSQFKAHWEQRSLFTIQTPWEILKNMAILSLVAIQSEETNMITDFEITFKQIRFATSELFKRQRQSNLSESQKYLIDSAFKQTRLLDQASPVVDHGTSTPAPSIPIFTGSGF